MKIYFVRHGQTNANTEMKNGQSIQELDEPLNSTGEKQAEALAEELKDVKFDLIISSTLKRAQQTAKIVSRYHEVPVETEENLRERDAGAYIDANTWHDLFDFDKNIQLEDGESLPDFFDRVSKCFYNLKQNYPDKTILVVSHGGVHHVLHASFNNLPKSGNIRVSHMNNCDYRVYDL